MEGSKKEGQVGEGDEEEARGEDVSRKHCK
jgi:hypothetical protein